MQNRRLMEADKQLARPSAFATGRAPTALAAFVKRPQAVRFKSALALQYGLTH
jgi:precorrin isomerase